MKRVAIFRECRDGHRRTTGRDFLADCPPRVAEIFRYWDLKRNGRAMPRRRDISPSDFRHHLPRVILVDVEGLDEYGLGIYRYRVVGTEEAEQRGYDPTGRLVQEGFFGPDWDNVHLCYETVRSSRGFLYDPCDYWTADRNWRCEHTIFLPLSEDGESVSQILVYSAVSKPA